MKWFAAALLAVLVLLQYRIWFSGDSVREVLKLRSAVTGQQLENERLSARNRQLAAEVRDLKQGYAALEERARSDLGMVGANETFFQVGPSEQPLPAPPAAPREPGAGQAPPPARTAAVR